MIEQDYEQEQKILLAGLLDTDRNPISKFYLGSLYYNGDFFSQNYTTAFSYYSQAANMQTNYTLESKYQNFAKYNLGIMLFYGKGVTQDYKQAFSWINNAAKNGDAESLWLSGKMYQAGMGVNPDYAKAFANYRLAANQEHPLALIKVNKTNHYGLACWPSTFISIIKERSSLISGSMIYPVALAKSLHLDKVKKIIELYNKNKNICGVDLTRNLVEGNFYEQFIGKDAMTWLLQVANHGIHEGYYLIGEFYLRIISHYDANYANMNTHQKNMYYLDTQKFLIEESSMLQYRELLSLTAELQELNLFIISYAVAKASFTKALSGGYNKAKRKLVNLGKYVAVEQFNHTNIMYNYNYIVQKINEDYKIFNNIEQLLRDNMFLSKPELMLQKEYNYIIKDIKNIWQHNNTYDRFKRLLLFKKIYKINVNCMIIDLNLSLLECLVIQKDITSVRTLLNRPEININFGNPLLYAIQNQDKDILKLLLSYSELKISRQCNKLLSAEQLDFFKSAIDDIDNINEQSTTNNYNRNMLFDFKKVVANLQPYVEDTHQQASASSRRLDKRFFSKMLF
jgi:TPR repeat protein